MPKRKSTIGSETVWGHIWATNHRQWWATLNRCLAICLLSGRAETGQLPKEITGKQGFSQGPQRGSRGPAGHPPMGGGGGVVAAGPESGWLQQPPCPGKGLQSKKEMHGRIGGNREALRCLREGGCCAHPLPGAGRGGQGPPPGTHRLCCGIEGDHCKNGNGRWGEAQCAILLSADRRCPYPFSVARPTANPHSSCVPIGHWKAYVWAAVP